MTARIIDLMCDRHRTLILDTRMWPADYIPGNHNPGNNSCYDCGEVGGRQPSGPIEVRIAGVERREEYAVHEAGHAVAYLVQGVDVGYAALEPGDQPGTNAHTSLYLPPHWHGTMPHLIGLWAGHEATVLWLESMRLLDDAARIDVARGASSDSAMLRDFATSDRDIDQARLNAEDLVRRHQTAIERVADALLAAGRLTGEEIAAIAGLTCNA